MDEAGKYGQVWTVENATVRFTDGLKYAEENEDCLSLYDAIYETGIPYSTYFYLADRHDCLDSIKQDTQRAITKRVNRGAIKGKFNAAASIWRMKQNGEKDQTTVNQNISGKLDGDHKVIFEDYE